MEFSSFACFPVSRRTPVASYITTMDRTKHTANSKELTPYRSAAAVVSPHTVAECELGIPPEPTMRSQFIVRFSAKSSIVFSTWATIQPATALTSTWLLSISFQIFIQPSPN